MSRKGDIGPYAVENVFIQLAVVNNSQRRTSKSTFPMGVHQSGKKHFYATKMLNGKMHYLGTFETPEAAHRAYHQALP